MRISAMATVAVAALITAGCAMTPPSEPVVDVGAAASATADIRDTSGRSVAQASASQVGDSIRVRVDAAGLARGTYGAHVHQTGRCDPPGFESASGHWNPTDHQHGKDNPQGMHKGDLPNLLVGTDGRGTFEVTIPGAWLGNNASSMLDADGAALVIHANADDFRTNPSGNSGARIACGVFR